MPDEPAPDVAPEPGPLEPEPEPPAQQAVEGARLAELESRVAAVQASLDAANKQLGYLQPLIDSIREIESMETRPEHKRSSWLDRKLF